MKDIFLIKDTPANKISYYHLLAFVISLPFDRFYSQIVLISFIVHTLIHLKKEKIRSLPAAVWILASVFLLTVIGILYTGNKSQAFKDVEKQLAILLFPLFLGLSNIDLAQYKMRLLKAFSFTCTFVILYLYAYNFVVIFYNKLPLTNILSSHFLNHNFSAPIEMHATYLSMYIAISIVTLFQLLFTENSLFQKLLYQVAILILLIGLFQLSSRAVFVSTALIVNIVVPLLALKGKKSKRFFLIAASVTAIALITIFSVDVLKARYVTTLKDDLKAKSATSQISEPRFVRWQVALELVKKSPLIGYGTGNEISVLKEAYFTKHLYESFYFELNAHNEFLSFLLKTGIIGLALYLYLLCFGFINAWHSRDIVFMSFMIIITTVSFSENILDVNKGIFFFSFFLSLFTLSQKSIKAVPKWLKKKKNLQEHQPMV